MNFIERNPLDSDLLRTFATIADCGNLTLAAGQLNRTQSAISVQLRKLETRLDVALFERTSRGMTLTPAGELLLPKARLILAEIRQASMLFDKPLAGSIRIGLPDDFNDTRLGQILADFAQTHPGVNVVASSGCTSQYPAGIARGDMDIAVCSGPDNGEGETLGVEKTVWAKRKGAKIPLDRPVPLAILDRSCWWRDLPTTSLDTLGRDYTVAFRSSSFASLLAAIRAGFAIGVVPASSLGGSTAEPSRSEGFPNLAPSRRSILVAKDAPRDLTRAMIEAIKATGTKRQS